MADSPEPKKITRLLLVTHDEELADDVRYAARDGVEVVAAKDARQAWTLMQESVPSVVVVGIRTGSAGGFALCRDMDASPKLAKIPVMMLLERDQDEWLARQAGAELTRTVPVPAADVVSGALSLVS